MHVCVLGAGIIGLSTAYTLVRQGHRVTVVDRSTAASGASGSNGGQLSYSYVQPLADPSIWMQLPKLLLSPSSPLKIRPQLDVAQWKWGVKFLMACNANRSIQTTQRLLSIAALSRHHFDEFREREGLDCNFSATGKLVLYRSAEAFEAARRQLTLQKSLGGAQQHALTPGEVLAIEPALRHSIGDIAGGIHTPSECAADCQLVCDGLVALLRERGVRFVFETPVTGLSMRGREVTAARVHGGEIEADVFVLATGAASALLARQAGVEIPLYPLKGYSITVDIRAERTAPRVNVTDAARKVVFARIGDKLRVAGMAELVGDDRSIPQSRLDTLVQATESIFPGSCDMGNVRPWTGMRPATPTGEPIVGVHPDGPPNLVFNTGHGALGFTLAFGTAALVASDLRQLSQGMPVGAEAPQGRAAPLV